MRLYNEDVEEFARLVTPGTPVRIIDVPVKVGWKGGAMYVEVRGHSRKACTTRA
ncbi:MAG: L,D-transpeptidase [Gammaproteobacteria bacterium]|nr:L,D-transpeptidase [Gammaproteobacteria bacterium]